MANENGIYETNNPYVRTDSGELHRSDCINFSNDAVEEELQFLPDGVDETDCGFCEAV